MINNLAAPKLLASPNCYASGYSLHLYCDHENPKHGFQEFPHEYDGETFAECSKGARVAGWKFHYATRTATCPKCAKALNR